MSEREKERDRGKIDKERETVCVSERQTDRLRER